MYDLQENCCSDISEMVEKVLLVKILLHKTFLEQEFVFLSDQQLWSFWSNKHGTEIDIFMPHLKATDKLSKSL